MDVGYTRSIEDEYFSYYERTLSDTRCAIENISEDTTAEEWKKQLEELGKEFTCSARFYLMRHIQDNADAINEENQSFSYSYGGKEYCFHTVSARYAQEIPAEELKQYVELITEIAADRHNDEKRNWRPLVNKAMNKNKRIELINRSEGFKLAHGLGFNLEQTEKFLVRALDNDGISYTRSENLIESFCFLYNPCNDYYVAQKLKQEYKQKTIDVPKRRMEIRPEGFTRNMEDMLPFRISEWIADADCDTEELFMEWLVRQAQDLDIPGKSAYILYRRFAEYAYKLVKSRKVSSDDTEGVHFQVNTMWREEDDFSEAIRRNCLDSQYDLENVKLYELENRLSEEKIYEIANELVQHCSLEFDNPRKKKGELTWRYLTVDHKGNVVAKAIGNRIPKLLAGTEQITKADMLFIIWFVCELLWTERQDNILMYERIEGYYYWCEEVLGLSRLPAFYVPHMLERSFLNAIICSDRLNADYPFEVYEGFCEFFKTVTDKTSDLREEEEALDEVMEEGKSIVSVTEKDLELESDHKALKVYWKEETIHMYEQKEAYEGWEIFISLAEKVWNHIREYAVEKSQYEFSDQGIYYGNAGHSIKSPDRVPVISYPNKELGRCFYRKRAEHKSIEKKKQRFLLIYGIELYIREKGNYRGNEIVFRINVTDNTTLTINKLRKD